MKSLALPSWLGGYEPEAIDLTAESDLERWQSEPDVMRREYLAKDSFRTKNSKEISEYQNQLNTYFNEACEKNGIEPGMSCYRNLNANPEISEQVHQDVKESLGGDARMLELMDLLEVNL